MTNEIPDIEDSVPEKNSKAKEFFSYLRIIIIAVAAAIFVIFFVIINATVPTGSMIATINEGDRVIGLRLAYAFDTPQRGDIIIFKYPDDESVLYVKRVIGLPGDTVELYDGYVYINGEELDEPYLSQQQITYPAVTNNVSTFEVPENCYFMLGDNREHSKDSRYWENTYLKKDKILAKVMFRYYNGASHKIEFTGY